MFPLTLVVWSPVNLVCSRVILMLHSCDVGIISCSQLRHEAEQSPATVCVCVRVCVFWHCEGRCKRRRRLTRPVGDQAVSTLRLHLDVDAAGRLQRQHVRPVRGLIHLLPETRALQGAGDQPAARERAGRRPRQVAQGRHRAPEGQNKNGRRL